MKVPVDGERREISTADRRHEQNLDGERGLNPEGNPLCPVIVLRGPFKLNLREGDQQSQVLFVFELTKAVSVLLGQAVLLRLEPAAYAG